MVDQPASTGALAIAVAHDLGVDVAYLPGLAMRRIADLHPGQAKSDARVIADAARTMPHTLRRVGTDDETLTGLSVLAGYDDDLAAQSTRLTNRLRDALLHIHPPWNDYWASTSTAPAPWSPPHPPRRPGCPHPQTMSPLMRDGGSPRLAKSLPAKIQAALGEQTLTVPGTTEFDRVIAAVAAQLRDVHRERDQLAADLKARPGRPPSCPGPDLDAGIGVRTTLKILTIVGDGAAFPTAAHLASYAGPSPVTRRSGSSIKGETRSRAGNHALKNALFLSAFASLADPTSRAYYDRKRAQGKKHNAALICLARRRTDAIYAMLRDRRPGSSPPQPQPRTPQPLDKTIETPSLEREGGHDPV